MQVRNITLGEAVDRGAVRWGEAIGWVFESRRVSFVEMQRQADETARALLACGIKKGDIVAVLTPNLPEFAFCMMACGKIGAIVAPINTRSKIIETEHVLRHSEARLLIMVERFLNQDYRELLETLCGPKAIGAHGRVTSTALPGLAQIVGLEPDTDYLSWQDFIARGAAVPLSTLRDAQASLRPEEPVLLQYTSGTTAAPKGALCNHTYVVNFGTCIIERLGVREGEAFFNTQPFYHVGGSCGAIPTPLETGCRMVSPAYYDVEGALGLIEREKCVARSGFAAMYIMELSHPRFRDFDVSSLRTGWCIGPADLMPRIRDEMGIAGLVQIYGATEGGGTVGRIDDPWEKRSQSCGRPITGTEIAIVDPESGARRGANESGEIVCHGWFKMNGYLKQPEETARTIDAEGGMHTGDYGYLDEEGYLYFQGRLKNMLKVGGENVSAEEVEAMLMRHPKVKMVAVIGAPDPRLDEVVMAIVELNDGETATEREIIDFCTPLAANFRVPRHVRFTTDWPMTGSGKIQKHILYERYC